jgi:hypothetical protein
MAAFRESPIIGTGGMRLGTALAPTALAVDYPAYCAGQQSASPYIEEFAGFAFGKLLKGKIHGRYRDGAGPNHSHWLTIGVARAQMPRSRARIPTVVLQVFLYQEIAGPGLGNFLSL